MAERLKLRPDAVLWRRIEGEVVALDVRRSLYLGVNRSGAVLWPMLEEGATRDDLVAALRDQFDLEPESAAADVDAFLASLRDHDLIDAA